MRPISQLRAIAALSLAAFTAVMIVPSPAGAQPATTILAVQAMSTRKKVVLLAGAAALYWLYKRHQNSRGVGPNGQYYRSKNGRIYYRDARTHQAVWVTPPPASRPIQVPADEYQQYVGQLPPAYSAGAGNNRVLTAPPGPGYQ